MFLESIHLPHPTPPSLTHSPVHQNLWGPSASPSILRQTLPWLLAVLRVQSQSLTMAFKASLSSFLISASPRIAEDFPALTHSLNPSAKVGLSGDTSYALQKKVGASPELWASVSPLPGAGDSPRCRGPG